MALLIHTVGDADLGLNILNINEGQRDQLREQRTEALKKMLDQIDGDETKIDLLVQALFRLDYGDGHSNDRFTTTPLAQICEALKEESETGATCPKAERPVHILLLASMEGKMQTAPLARVLHEILSRPSVRSSIRHRYKIVVNTDMMNGGLNERDMLDKFSGILAKEKEKGLTDGVIVNAMSGSTTMMVAALGAADQSGLPWRLMLTPERGKSTATQVKQHQLSDNAEFKWLCSLGLLHDATVWAEGKGKDELVTEEIRDYAGIAERLSDAIDEGSLRKLACLWLMRADNSAGLAVRAWVQAHYEMLLEQENRSRAEPWSSVFMPSSNGRTPTLGEAIGKIEQQIKDGSPTSSAGSWLLTRAALNTIGNSAVHDAAVPTLAALEEARSIPELAAGAPPWMSWPAERPILYLYACGLGGHSKKKPIAERVLLQPPQQELLQAVPAGMLTDEPPLPIVLRLLHSSHPDSRNGARRERDIAINAVRDKRWRLFEGDRPAIQAVEYRPAGGEDAGQAAILQAARTETALVLAQLQPSAVVIVGTGSKGVVLGALQEAQQWCAIHAAPLFLQTFIDSDNDVDDSTSQFHRIAMHTGIEKALRNAAAASLRSLNLLSAVRVLSAGDYKMTVLAQGCDTLRQEYANAVTADNLDKHAGVVLGVLETIVDLWTDAQDDWETRIRLMVAAAEITRCKKKSDRKTISLLAKSATILEDKEIRKRREADSRCAVDNLTLSDLQRLLYMIRNNLVILHGSGTIDKSMDRGFDDAQVEREDMSYPDLLRKVIDRIKMDAQDLQTQDCSSDTPVLIDSDWMSRFKSLQDGVDAWVSSGEVEGDENFFQKD
ncbi:hypothetical protein J5X07_07785 [Actinomyces bowdenii]|uniref:hypothetical protein n=1 Tax=Actinomyces bowdenii TaxID=131109 RepID=UPI001ABBEAEF|nr:hypothetical protein [Actinomyces bowdenii]MBO3724925.1 hypothetical protein [Actinomyces bowdenii]